MTNSNITDDDIRALRRTATTAGDHAQALICDLATGDVDPEVDGSIHDLRIASFIGGKDLRRIAALSQQDCRDECISVIRAARGV